MGSGTGSKWVLGAVLGISSYPGPSQVPSPLSGYLARRSTVGPGDVMSCESGCLLASWGLLAAGYWRLGGLARIKTVSRSIKLSCQNYRIRFEVGSGGGFRDFKLSRFLPSPRTPARFSVYIYIYIYMYIYIYIFIYI